MIGEVIAAAITSPIIERAFAFVFALVLLWILNEQLGRVSRSLEKLVGRLDTESKLADRREKDAIRRESETRQRILDLGADIRQGGHS